MAVSELSVLEGHQKRKWPKGHILRAYWMIEEA
jgi:hypothetical protein